MNDSSDAPAAWAELQAQLTRDIQCQRALAKSVECVSRAERTLTGNERLSPVEQLEIYRVQFWLRHTSSLLEDFPGVSGILGQAAWEPLVEGYLQRFPPNSWTLRDLGHSFAAYIRDCAELPHRELCLDMARLEWAYTEVFDAPPGCTLDASKLAAIAEESWATAQMVMSPCMRSLRVEYPVAQLRRTLRDAAANGGHDSLRVRLPERRPQNLVVHRGADAGLYYSVVSDAAAALLDELAAGKPLLAACEAAAERVPGSASVIERQVGTWFGAWGAKGWIIDVRV